jgi:hypothetical protein
MKSLQQRFLIMTILIYAFSFSSYGQQVERTITLVCNTAKLKDMKPKNAHRVCYFNGYPGSDPRQFTVNAVVEDTLIWNGKPLSGSDELNITKIKYEKGTKIFDKDSIEGTKTVKAVAKYSTKGKKPYTYKIYFKINNTKKQYFIDPKVSVIPRG